jgi:hypothetical protein
VREMKTVQRETGGDSGEEGTESEEEMEANIGNAINSGRGQAGSGEVEEGRTEVEEPACSVFFLFFFSNGNFFFQRG